MPVALMWFLILLVGVASLLCNSAAWLWMAAKWCRIPNISYPRALAVMALLTVIGLMLRAAGLFLDEHVGTVLAVLGLYAVAAIACVRRILHTTTRRAIAVGLIASVTSSISALPVIILFKLFLIEGFSVPSGSMALAFIGKHFDVTCDRCGRKFAVSAREADEQRARERRNATGRFSATRYEEPQQFSHCPNCGVERAIAADRPIAAGDKFLVDKTGVPRRWDAIVFKYPGDISVTYLKRLIGLPGEKVEIIAGDIFINDHREAKPFGVCQDLWILVNDTRLRASDSSTDDPQWRTEEAGSNWRWDQQGWVFSGVNSRAQEIIFSGPTTDELFFAERRAGQPLSLAEPQLESGDLQVSCRLANFAGDGSLGFRWTFRSYEVVARVTGSGDVDLRTDHGNQQVRLPQHLAEVESIVFAVRDGTAMLVADGQVIATGPIGPQDAATCRKIKEAETKPCQIAITAEHCDVALAQIVLERDVYYRSDNFHGNGCTGKPITLGPQEHFVLGDHSARANDSRLWDEIDASLHGRYQVGTVPSELMIGMARCIYWPPARWHAMR